ncbi:hypothetical protein NKH77_27290 [Streptomyces sp. M19]
MRWAAHRLIELFDELGLPTRLMTTGSRGLHVIVPLDRGADFDAVRAFARDAADLLAGRHPDRLTTEPRKANRRGASTWTSSATRTRRRWWPRTPYAPAPAPRRHPVAADELDDPDLAPDRWTITTIGERLSADPWSGTVRGGRCGRRPGGCANCRAELPTRTGVPVVRAARDARSRWPNKGVGKAR